MVAVVVVVEVVAEVDPGELLVSMLTKEGAD